MNEKKILTNLNHNFLVNMISSFQDRNYLYLLIDLMIGGDLRFHICIHKYFSEDKIKFFAGCLILAFEYLYEKKIIHRDIKPENIVLDENGYLKLTDFGISRKYSTENYTETSGTPGYMSPEVLLRENHSYECDYFALGVILFECISGKRPYNGKNRKEIRNQVLSFQAKLNKKDHPKYSEESINFVNALLQRKKKKRIGYKGVSELRNHKWFDNFNWNKLSKNEIKAPFIPNIKTFFEYLKHLSEDSDQETMEYANIINNKKELFQGYSYNNLIKWNTNKNKSQEKKITWKKEKTNNNNAYNNYKWNLKKKLIISSKTKNKNK